MDTSSLPSGSSSPSEVEVNWVAEDTKEGEYAPRHSLGFYAAAVDLGYRLHTETFIGRRVA